MDKPRAAAAIWPYPHRNMAEVMEAEQASLARSLRQLDEDRAFDFQVRRLQAAARAEGLCASMGEETA